MSVAQSHYEELLANCSSQPMAIEILRQHRPYLEMLPSIRRPEESLITIPFPTARIRGLSQTGQEGTKPSQGELVRLPCDVAVIMCDPDWKVKTGTEIFIFIHRPQEDFSDLLGRWRQTQVWLDKGYEWLMPPRYQHVFNDGRGEPYPLFIVFDETPDRIKRGLQGAGLPYVAQILGIPVDEEQPQRSVPAEGLGAED